MILCLSLLSRCSIDPESKAGSHHVWASVCTDLAVLQVRLHSSFGQLLTVSLLNNVADMTGFCSAGSSARYYAAVVPLLNALR